MKNLISIWFLSLCLLHLSCGGGSIRIDRNQGVESAVNGVGGSGDNAMVFFTNEIHPLLISNRQSSQNGCAASGCHKRNDASSNVQTFFQIDSSSASDSWNWAQVRRNRVVAGSYAQASPGSDTIQNRKNQNHNSFNDWTSAEKAKIDSWVALPQ